MNKLTSVFVAAAAVLAVSTVAASAAPITLAGATVAPLANPPGVDDALQIFLNGSQVGGFPITLAGEATCANPATPINGCSFSRDAFTFGGGSISVGPNGAMSNQIAVFYAPDGVTIDAIFAIGCDNTRDASTGLCIGTPNFTIVTPDPAHAFDFSQLAGAHVTIGFTGTEIAGNLPTAFDLTNYLTVTGAAEGQNYTALLVLNNAVPEPMTLSLFGAGLAGAAALRRRRKAKA
jgi:hypothetical protein